MPMQNLLLLAELNTSGVCPCKIYCFWQHRGHCVCAHAEFITFGRTEGIGCVPMHNLLLLARRRHWVCAHAKFIAFGKTEGIGFVRMQILLLLAGRKALGVCPCRIYCFWLAGRHWVSAHAKFVTFGGSWHGHTPSAFRSATGGAEGGRTSTPTSAPTCPVAAAVTLHLDATSPRPVTNPGTMGRSCNPHLTCHMGRAQAAAVVPLLDANSPHPLTKPKTMGSAAPVLQALQHYFSDAASIAALVLSCCKHCSSPSLPHGSSAGAPAAALQLDEVIPHPITNPRTMGGCCLPLHPPHGGAHGRIAVHSQPASHMRCAWAQADHTTSKKAQTGHPALGT